MTRDQKRTIREVIHATETHRAVLLNSLEHKKRVTKGDLEDLVDGMAISLDKLERLFEKLCWKCGSPLRRDGKCGDKTCPYSDRKQGDKYTEG